MRQEKREAMVKVFIDDTPYEFAEGLTIFNAAKEVGISIPHFCYHPAFLPEGTCRMCLVEIEGYPKLELSCSTTLRDGMKIYTSTEKVVNARQGVLEFLLAEHPLDCPICDQAGDCTLQDYYEDYGLNEPRFFETKEKRGKRVDIGKNLVHDQERCILCRRCVRFLRDITQTQELGVFERGNHTEVNIYEGRPVNNHYSGNLAQLCPVGAITDRDFRFKTRNWFLESGDSICPFCSRGCAITIDYHKGFARFPVAKRVYRINARKNSKVNSFWICDVGRYGYEYINLERQKTLSGPDKNRDYSWEEILSDYSKRLNRQRFSNRTANITIICNSWMTNEELFLVRKIFQGDLPNGRIQLLDPPDEKGDNFLLTPERVPNRRGAVELGFETNPLDMERLKEETDLLIVFGTYLLEHSNRSELEAVLGSVEQSILFTPYPHELNELFDMVLPAALIPESEGSLTNVDGLVQPFEKVLEPPGESRAVWRILRDLGKSLNIHFAYYRGLDSVEAIRTEMGKEISFFRK